MDTVITTDKQAFQFIKQKLLEQKNKSIDAYNETCCYRACSQKKFEELYEKQFGKQLFGIDLTEITEEQYNIITQLSISGKNSDLKCAVGHIIDDELYHPLIEGNPVDSDDVLELVKCSNEQWHINDKSLAMLTAVQRIHDHFYTEDWEILFNQLEEEFDSSGSYNLIDNKEFFETAKLNRY